MFLTIFIINALVFPTLEEFFFLTSGKSKFSISYNNYYKNMMKYFKNVFSTWRKSKFLSHHPSIFKMTSKFHLHLNTLQLMPPKILLILQNFFSKVPLEDEILLPMDHNQRRHSHAGLRILGRAAARDFTGRKSFLHIMRFRGLMVWP